MDGDNTFHIAKTTKIKREVLWSTRIVNWKNDELYYHKDERDATKPRFQINLRTCGVYIVRGSKNAPIMVLTNKGDDILKIDMGSHKFCDLIIGKLASIGIDVKDVDGPKSSREDPPSPSKISRHSVPRGASIDPSQSKLTADSLLVNQLQNSEVFGRPRGSVINQDQSKLVYEEEESSEEEDEKYGQANRPLSDAAKAYLILKNQIRTKMVFVDRSSGVSVYGLHDDKDIGFKQVRRIRQIREMIAKIISLKKYELGFYMILLSAFLFSLMSFSQLLLFSMALASLLWIVSTLATSSHNHFYYLKKDIKLFKSHYGSRGPKSTGSFQAEDVDASFGDELAQSIVSGRFRPTRIFQGLQGILIRLLITSRRKRFMPFVVQTETKGHITKCVNEDGTSNYYMQHFMKQGKHHFAAIELEKFSGQITQIFELKYIPKSSTVVLSVYLRQTDSHTSVATVDALCRELTVICEEEDQLAEALKSSYFKHCEFLPKYLNKTKDFDFDNIRAVPEIAQDYYAPPLDTLQTEVEKPQDQILQAKPVDSKIDKSDDIKHVDDIKTLIDDKVDNSHVDKDEPKEGPKMVMNEEKKDEILEGGPKVIFGLEIKPEMPEVAVKIFEEKMKLLAKVNNLKNGEWNHMETTRTGIDIYDSTSGDYLRLYSVYKIPLPFDEILPYSRDVMFRLKYDELLRSIDMVKTYTDTMCIVRIQVKGSFPVSDREFLAYGVFIRPDNDTAIALSYDAVGYEHPKTKAVRGSLELSASIFKRISPTETEFILISSSNPALKGVPQSLIKSKSKQSALAPYQFYECIKKQKK